MSDEPKEVAYFIHGESLITEFTILMDELKAYRVIERAWLLRTTARQMDLWGRVQNFTRGGPFSSFELFLGLLHTGSLNLSHATQSKTSLKDSISTFWSSGLITAPRIASHDGASVPGLG
jgi:hypothetical protein